MSYFHRFNLKSQRLRDFRRSRSAVLIEDHKGQAMIEYLLMVVLMVVLLVALTVALFQPLQNFLGDLNNKYVRCLLETGELPRVGVDSTSAASCDADLPKFQARNLDGSTDKPGGSKGSKNSENEKGESSSADGSSGTDAGGGSSGSASSSRVTKSSLIRNGMRSMGNARSEQASDKTTTIPVDDFSAGEGFNASGSGRVSSNSKKKTRKIDLSGLSEYDRKKIEKQQDKNRTIAVDSEEFTQKRNKKIIVKPPPQKQLEDDLNVQTDFSAYFKIFFFILIILFIIILMGSQAMQMTNNSDN